MAVFCSPSRYPAVRYAHNALEVNGFACWRTMFLVERLPAVRPVVLAVRALLFSE